MSRLITFFVGEQAYGLPLLTAGEFCPTYEITPVAGVDERVRGVTHLRGVSTVVLDMRKILRVPPRAADLPGESILILPQDELCHDANVHGLATFGEPVILEVDALDKIVDLSADFKHPTPSHLEEPFYDGIYETGQRDLIALDFGELIRFLEKDFHEV